MATQYIILSGRAAAAAQNAAWWEKVLGRTKLAGDVTSVLFRIVPHPTADTALVYVTDRELEMILPKLSASELSTFNAQVKQASDPAVIQFKAEAGVI